MLLDAGVAGCWLAVEVISNNDVGVEYVGDGFFKGIVSLVLSCVHSRLSGINSFRCRRR